MPNLTERLRGLSILKAMMLVAAIPLLSVVVLSLIVIVPQVNSAREFGKLRDLVLLSTEMAELVHEQQVERGSSAVFLSSIGTKFREKLTAQRQETDI